jgi:glycyl-tRNA synthetase beta chain
MSEELLLEIGTEEIPAAFMPDALAALKDLATRSLAAGRIDFQDIRTQGTPRRLVLMATGVARGQKDLVSQKVGPARSVAYDHSGNPTKAAIGFARGLGLDVGALKTVTTPKGEYICAERREVGRPTIEVLPEILCGVITAIPFPKSMRWHDFDVRFARPIHWILALFGGSVVPLRVGNIDSADTTCGHRFMSPAAVRVTGIRDYTQAVRTAQVLIDPEERTRAIADQLQQLADKAGGLPDQDARLLEEVAWLVESPHAVLCSFRKDFLKLPVAVLLTTMKKHQRYFPVLDSSGRPLPHFIAVNNTRAAAPGVVIAGHERVLRARLSDAQFFFSEDCKRPLTTMTESLRQVVFQSKLGTSHEKVVRFQQLALFIAGTFVNPGLKATIERAAYLCKADLVSEMVKEFPELQGIMGREYAAAAGEPEQVSQAIYEHYLPRFAGDALPASDAGAVISIADKLDTIAGCFGVGLIPTGTADPYALRRQSLGIINIILGRRYAIDLGAVVSQAIALLESKLTRPAAEVRRDVLGFVSGRLANLLASQGLPEDVVDAVLSLGIDNLVDCVRRIEALQQMKQDPSFESLAVSFKRVVNILAAAAPRSVDPARLQQAEEKGLYQKYLDIRERVAECMAQHSYGEALQIIATIRAAVDGFFDHVLVMAPEEDLRQNRLALLQEVSSLFKNFADFSRIASPQQ